MPREFFARYPLSDTEGPLGWARLSAIFLIGSNVVSNVPFILVVSPSLNVATLPELLARLRAGPGKYNYASSGTGSVSQLGLEMLKLAAKVDMVNVNFKGAAPSIAALLSGEVHMALLGPLSVKPHLANGRLRALAVSTAKRSPGNNHPTSRPRCNGVKRRSTALPVSASICFQQLSFRS